MTNPRGSSALQQLRALFATGNTAGLTDLQLLERFTAERAASLDAAAAAEAAFAALGDGKESGTGPIMVD
jgi:hypothetical protein